MEEPGSVATPGLDTQKGVVTGIIYRNEDNGYTILRLDTGGQEITVVGTLPGVSPGEYLTVQGRWTRHPTYGAQLRAETFSRRLPREQKDLFLYLASGAVRGVGRATARQLVDEFGEDVLDVIESHPEQLTKLRGISPSRAKLISDSFRTTMWMRRLTEFLSEYSLPLELAAPLRRSFGETALEALKANPYLLTREGFDVEFARVDRLAASLGMGKLDRQRLEAGLIYELTFNLEHGHTFLPWDKLLDATWKLLTSADTDSLTRTLEDLVSRGELIQDQVAGERAVYLPGLHEAEVAVARRILRLCDAQPQPPEDLDRLISRIQSEQKITYAPQQRRAVELAASRQVILLTGGPGTGKTTCLRGVLALYSALGLQTALAAPTGRAAKRLGELCQADASTIHRLLETGYDRRSGRLKFQHSFTDPLPVGALIVDETSMVDLPLMAALLDALRDDCRLVLVGDPDQLPSVGPGSLFADLIRSEVVPTVRLTDIFRQAAESAIIRSAHKVNRGLPPELENQGDFFFLSRPDPQDALDTIVDLCRRRLPERMGIPTDQIQVLSPTRRRTTGTGTLNQVLQAALNPPLENKGERRFGDWVYRAGDRVMQVKNNYDIPWREEHGRDAGLGMFNGEIGVIRSIAGDAITVDFDGKIVTYTPEMLGELEPAFAITVHKAQGAEYRAVILAAVEGNPFLYTRSVLYTAITRARELLIIVGSRKTVLDMVGNNRQSRRYSGLRYRLVNPSQAELEPFPPSPPPEPPAPPASAGAGRYRIPVEGDTPSPEEEVSLPFPEEDP